MLTTPVVSCNCRAWKCMFLTRGGENNFFGIKYTVYIILIVLSFLFAASPRKTAILFNRRGKKNSCSRRLTSTDRSSFNKGNKTLLVHVHARCVECVLSDGRNNNLFYFRIFCSVLSFAFDFSHPTPIPAELSL